MVVFSYYPLDVRVRRAAEAIVEAGMGVDLICLRGEGERKKECFNGVNVHRIKLQRKRSSTLRYMWEYGYFILSSFLLLSYLHIIRRYRIVHVHTLPDILVLCALIPKLSGARIILDIHDIMPELYMRKYHIPETHPIIRTISFLEKVSISFSDHVVTASPFFRKRLLQRSSSAAKCTTILNLPDPQHLPTPTQPCASPNGTFNIIYPGTLGEIHGVDVAIRAIERVDKQTDIPVRFHIYGEGSAEERDKLISLSRQLSIENLVCFHRKVPLEQLSQIYKTMHIGLVPKRGGLFADDAMSTKLFEYAAVRLPAIVSRTESDSYYFDDSMVIFFEPGNEDELADSIIRLYQDQNLRHRLSERALTLFNKINWQVEKTHLCTVYERALSS